MKILFFGTAEISKIYLEILHRDGYELFVITASDKPALRGQRLTRPAVKVFAVKNNINFIQPEKLDSTVIKTVKDFNPDVGIAVAYGKLIPKTVFDLPKYKTFNIHFSLLPKYRGAAPVQRALYNGETETGVSAFYIKEGFDTGDTIIQKKLKIDINDNAETLFAKLIPLGVNLMNEILSLFRHGKTDALPQIGKPSYAPTFKKKDGLVDWKKSADVIYNQFRGLYIWPGLCSVISQGKLLGKKIRFINIEVFEKDSVNKSFGVVSSKEKNKGFTVSCGIGKMLITKIQPESKAVMSAWDFVQGRQILVGDRFQS
ncbi:MAG: methionyl-tRNA formyltransferase [Endomicrobium sp.]|nr:methionyl-tRNA formyltransferase [Endomicrobium sp.]